MWEEVDGTSSSTDNTEEHDEWGGGWGTYTSVNISRDGGLIRSVADSSWNK